MVKFKLRIFKSCQTKPSSPPPEQSSPACQPNKQITGDPPFATPPSPSPRRSSSSFKTHVIAKLQDVNDNRLRFPLLPVPPFYEKRNRRKMKTNTSLAGSHRFSTSYTVHDVGEGEERPETLRRPRRSFSDVGVRSGYSVGGCGEVSPEWGSPRRLSVFKKLMPCKVEGRVKESFVVVKRSEMPYEDFKKSMMEMIVVNQMYDENDLKQLLQCFLSLNSWYHYSVIMEAFSEIWNTIFLHR